MQGADGEYAVINTRERAPFFKAVAGALSQTRAMHMVDAMNQAKKRPYIFDAGCTLQQAKALWELLHKEGVESAIVPMDYFTTIGAAHMLNNANCLPGSFEIQPLTGPPLQIDWKELAMISYGRVKHRQRKLPGGTVGTTGPGPMATLASAVVAGPVYAAYRASHPIVKQDAKPKDQTEVHDCLDIFVGYINNDEFAAHFRVFAGKFYYDYLGERRQPTSAANFRLFVEDIVRYASDAILTDDTRQFLARRPPGKPIEGFDIFDEYNRWSVAIARARAEGKVS